jgi:hypothetical protein
MWRAATALIVAFAKTTSDEGWPRMSIVGDEACLVPAGPGELAVLAGFRSGLRACLTARGDALFDLGDALACAPGPVRGVAHLSLEPEFRRGWAMAYQALARGAVDEGRLKDLLAAVRPAGPAWFAADSSAYPGLAAVTSPDRTYVHHPSLQVNGSPRIPGWKWQWVAQVGTAPTSWTAPLDAARVPSDSTASRVAAGQVRDLVARLGDAGEVPLFIFDAGYDATGLSMDLHHGPDPVRCQVLVRLARSRMFYTEPAPRRPGARGRPAVHGPVFRCADPGTWPAAWQDLSWDDPVYGRVRVRAWARVHPRINAGRDQPGHVRQAPRPVIRGTVIRVDVERLRGVPGPAFLWLWHSGPDAPDPAGCARAYLRRYDIEHTLRFAKQELGWTAPALRTPAQAQVWTWLVIAAFTQLRLARPLADARLPWDHSARPVTPARARRAFRALRAILGTPAGPPKPSGRSPGRPPGRRSAPAPRHRVISKTPRKPAKRKKTRKTRKARTTPATPKS